MYVESGEKKNRIRPAESHRILTTGQNLDGWVTRPTAVILAIGFNFSISMPGKLRMPCVCVLFCFQQICLQILNSFLAAGYPDIRRMEPVIRCNPI